MREVQQPRFAVPMQYSTPEDVAKKARVVASRQEPDGYPATGATVSILGTTFNVRILEPHSQAQ